MSKDKKNSATPFENEVLPETAGLCLCKIVKEELRMSEDIRFVKGRPAVIRTLRLAQISGMVGGGVDSSTDFWVDQLDVKGNLIGEIALDRKSWNSLKNRWMRCRMTDYE